jgi:hypothetical protein
LIIHQNSLFKTFSNLHQKLVTGLVIYLILNY